MKKIFFAQYLQENQFFEDSSGNVDIANNITVGGTVDGRDLATDGSKLDNVAANATAYANSDVDTHLNQSSASSGQYLNWNGSDYAWSTISAPSVTETSTTTFTNKSINLSDNTLSGTTAQFNTALSDGSFRVGYGAGEVIEHLTGTCDGRSVTGKSGTYTWPTAAAQVPSTSYVDLSGSSISYTPPSEANVVKYDFNFRFSIGNAGSPLFHFAFYFDGTEVGHARATSYLTYEGIMHFQIPLSLNNSTVNEDSGKIGTWNTAKTIKMQVRAFSSSFLGELHTTHYYNGGLLRTLVYPTLSITAIA